MRTLLLMPLLMPLRCYFARHYTLMLRHAATRCHQLYAVRHDDAIDITPARRLFLGRHMPLIIATPPRLRRAMLPLLDFTPSYDGDVTQQCRHCHAMPPCLRCRVLPRAAFALRHEMLLRR